MNDDPTQSPPPPPAPAAPVQDAAGVHGDEGPPSAASAATTTRPVGSQFSRVVHSPFRHLLYASFTSSLGDWVGLVAIIAFTTSTLGSGTRAAAFGLSAVMVARVVPTMLLGPVAGVFADRWDRRRLLIITDIGRGLVMLALPFADDVWAILLATLAVEVMATLFIPVKDALVPNLVPRGHLVQANQLSLLSSYGTMPLGGFLYAALVSMTGLFPTWEFVQARPAALAIWLNAASFFLSAVFVSRIPGISGRSALASRDEDRPGAWQELVEGLRFIANQPLVRALVTGVMGASLAAGAVIAVGEFYAEVVGAGANGFGLLQGLVGTGLFVGVVATNWLEPRIAKERVFAPGIALAGGALIVTALMPRFDLAAAPALLMGAGGGLAFLTGYTLLQQYSSDDVRGRTFGAFNTGVRFALFVSLSAAPFLVGLIGQESGDTYSIGGVRITLLIAGGIALASAVWCGASIARVLREAGTDLRPTRETRGLFIAFEGGDGAGKSTQIDLLAAALAEVGLAPVVTREPGGTQIGERIRDVVLDPSTPELSDRTEALLYAAARAQHVAEVIAPALADNRVVISDRFVDSSVVYQGVARGLGSTEVRRLNRWGTDDIGPDMVVLLDVPADEGLRRAGRQPDRLEGAGLDFHTAVNDAFRRLAVMTPERYLSVDATLPVEEVHDQIRAAVWERLRLDDTTPDPASPAAVPDASGLDATPDREDLVDGDAPADAVDLPAPDAVDLPAPDAAEPDTAGAARNGSAVPDEQPDAAASPSRMP